MTIYFHYSLYGFSNVYFVGNDETKEALIVDPAEFTVSLLNYVEKNGFRIAAVLVTHNHAHHVRGLATLLRIYDAKVYAGVNTIDSLPCSLVHDGDVFDVCGMRTEAFSVPGHSSDSIVYKMDKVLFTGDTLHAGLVGGTLSQYGYGLLRDQVKAKILSQSDDCMILPGHGPPSTVGAERFFNIGVQKRSTGRRKPKYDLFVDG